jgi:hypothetical protein
VSLELPEHFCTMERRSRLRFPCDQLALVQMQNKRRMKNSKIGIVAVALLVGCASSVCAVADAIPTGAPAKAAVASPATLVVSEQELPREPTLIVYGDMRFTDSANVSATNPAARQALVAKIAEERPDALFLGGDVPYVGGNKADYAEFHRETEAWRQARLRVYPALGNHEFRDCDEPACLENWWAEFPQLAGRRWYSVQLGSRFYAIALDSDAPLTPGSEQSLWLQAQLIRLPASVRFMLIWLHHPPVADSLTGLWHDSTRANEVALRDFLKSAAEKSPAKFVVAAAHFHNYERFLQDGIVYLVSGGGGAKPTPVVRSADDLYKDPTFPNYHYVKLELKDDRIEGTMYRLEDATSAQAKWTGRDRFEVLAK